MKKQDWLYLAVVVFVIYFFSKLFERQEITNIESHLKKLAPAIRWKFESFITDVKRLGFTPVIRESVRSYSQQKIYYSQDKRNAQPGKSLHEIGFAIDMDLHKNNIIYSKRTNRNAWINTGIPALAKKYGIRWGGNFKGYPDNNHFDIQQT